MSLTDYVIMPSEDYKAMCKSVRIKTGGTGVLKSWEIAPLIDGITGEITISEDNIDVSLSDYVIMPGADYQAICDSVRAKTGSTGVLKSGEIAVLIDSIFAKQEGNDFISETKVNMSYVANDGAYTGTITVDTLPTEGQTYVVVWDGTEYICKCRSVTAKFSTLTATQNNALGNPYARPKVIGHTASYPNDTNTGEPFYIFQKNSTSLYVHTQDTSTTHTIRIYQI